MNPQYDEGRQARRMGKPASACPWGFEGSRETDDELTRAKSPLCLRHWWLAGWSDADIEGAA